MSTGGVLRTRQPGQAGSGRTGPRHRWPAEGSRAGGQRARTGHNTLQFGPSPPGYSRSTLSRLEGKRKGRGGGKLPAGGARVHTLTLAVSESGEVPTEVMAAAGWQRWIWEARRLRRSGKQAEPLAAGESKGVAASTAGSGRSVYLAGARVLQPFPRALGVAWLRLSFVNEGGEPRARRAEERQRWGRAASFSTSMQEGRRSRRRQKGIVAGSEEEGSWKGELQLLFPPGSDHWGGRAPWRA